MDHSIVRHAACRVVFSVMAVAVLAGLLAMLSNCASSSQPQQFPTPGVFINHDKRFSSTSGFSMFPSEGPSGHPWKTSGGHPHAKADVEWNYLRATRAGDEYRVTICVTTPAFDDPEPFDALAAPRGSASTTTTKTVTYTGQPLMLYEDDAYRILLLTREDHEKNYSPRFTNNSPASPAWHQ